MRRMSPKKKAAQAPAVVRERGAPVSLYPLDLATALGAAMKVGNDRVKQQKTPAKPAKKARAKRAKKTPRD